MSSQTFVDNVRLWLVFKADFRLEKNDGEEQRFWQEEELGQRLHMVLVSDNWVDEVVLPILPFDSPVFGINLSRDMPALILRLNDKHAVGGKNHMLHAGGASPIQTWHMDMAKYPILFLRQAM